MAKGYRGRGRGEQRSRPPTCRQTRRPTRLQPLGRRSPPSRVATPGPRPQNPPPGPPKTPGTPKLFGSPPRPADSKGHPEPLGVSSEDIHVTTGVQHVKGCCVLHVCMLTLWEGCSILKVQASKKSSKNFFDAILLVFGQLLQQLKNVTNTTTVPTHGHPLAITKNCHSTRSHNWSKAL